MTEKEFRQEVIRSLRQAGQDPYSVENAVCPGMPDVNFLGGWLELKYLRDWPARPTTIVTLPHYTAQQQAWLRRRWAAGGGAWLYIGVGSDRLLVPGKYAEVPGTCTREALEEISFAKWHGAPHGVELVAALRTSRGAPKENR